ncbi:MAG: tRNA (5-methylaminomethyl-2-thiouridine)(34)-methyltransferase MnmD [Tannerellaceae bacterium]|nr:tRNA (5-methylaminomethyl-2-thiouridine)(34)-methyltransferase MnmD [Tannerellaceae bacterium]
MVTRITEITADGSHTLYIPEMDEHYHSVNGAVQESRHVFIEAGLHQVKKEKIRIVEIGFGTGLNALLTWVDTANERDREIEYYAVERYPLPLEVVRTLNYGGKVCPGKEELFPALHTAPWDKPVVLSDRFMLHKMQGDSHTILLPDRIDLVYFDAFAPDKQPEMWTREIFHTLYHHMADGGILTTYCAKGSVRRMMKETGYAVERIPGPPGKREMLRATKKEKG